jgi:hypothetical protein
MEGLSSNLLYQILRYIPKVIGALECTSTSIYEKIAKYEYYMQALIEDLY